VEAKDLEALASRRLKKDTDPGINEVEDARKR